MASIAPGIPPTPVGLAASAADATSAPLATNVSAPELVSNFHDRNDSFSPQTKTIGPFEPSQYAGEPCRWWVLFGRSLGSPSGKSMFPVADKPTPLYVIKMGGDFNTLISAIFLPRFFRSST